MEQFTVFDVETPNSRNDSICQIGVIHEFRGELTLIDRLVNPECDFSYINTGIHGITCEDVHHEPLFLSVWEEIREYFHCNLVIGHNVTFDLAVLNKTLHRYGEPLIEVDYIDTMRMMKYLGLRSSLDFSCAYFGIDLKNHHNALADAYATHQLFHRLKQEIPDYQAFIKRYAFDPSTGRMRRGSMETAGRKAGSQVGKGPGLAEILSENGLAELEKTCPDLFGKKVCLSGTFRWGSKNEVKKALEAQGAEVLDAVTLKIDYLIAGSIPNTMWAHGSYGSKIRKAMDMMKKGHPVRIVPEEAVFKKQAR